MKKIFNIAVSIALLLGATSCTDLLDPGLRETGQQIPDNAKVTLYFGIPEEVTTKADMDVEPEIESIHVFVFNNAGILVETAEADKFGKVTANGLGAYNEETGLYANPRQWAVTLTMSGSERRLHFIANLPKDSNGEFMIPESGSEASVFQRLATAYPDAAYWQRRILSYGINAYQYDGTKYYDYVDNDGVFKHVIVPHYNKETGQQITDESGFDANGMYIDANGNEVVKDDYIDRDGCKIVKGYGFYAVDHMVEMVPMIRNFARFRVKSTWTNDQNQTFTLTRAALVNKPLAGFVAPFDFSTSSFVQEYMNITDDNVPQMENLGNYTVTIPGAGIDKSEPTSFEPADNTTHTVVLYSYERPKPTSDPLCILLAGKWNGAGDEIWYKIEITDDKGQYFPIYRDFVYDVTIKSIEGNNGYKTTGNVQGSTLAFKGPAVGDFSNSPETQTLTQVSDDKGLTLWVSYIDDVLLNGNIPDDDTDPDRYVTLLYTCYRERTNSAGVVQERIFLNDHDQISFTRNKYPESNFPYATADIDSIPEGYPRAVTPADGVDVPFNDDFGMQWYIVKFKLRKLEGVPYVDDQTGVGSFLRSQIHVEANVKAQYNILENEEEGYAKKISRDVTYTVMPPQNISSVTTTGINAQAGLTTTLTIVLPETLTPAVFPMDLIIEAENNALMPVGDLPVGIGKSAFPSKTNETFYFVKSVAYSDYYTLEGGLTNEVTCVFETTRENANNTNIRVYDKKGFLIPVEVKLDSNNNTGTNVTD